MTFTHVHEEDFMTVIIGIDPYKANMAVAIDRDATSQAVRIRDSPARRLVRQETVKLRLTLVAAL